MNESITNRYFLLNKPANMVSQFVSDSDVRLLKDLNFEFPEGTHAIGRLDADSEGLLILTTNKKVTRLLFSGKKHTRVYLVMVKHVVTEATLNKLKSGIEITIKNGIQYKSSPMDISIVKDPFILYKYADDHRIAYPHTWLLITLNEGKYHQVRKMVFNAGHRCLRLIRISIENITVDGIVPGELREVKEDEFFSLLKIEAHY